MSEPRIRYFRAFQYTNGEISQAVGRSNQYVEEAPVWIKDFSHWLDPEVRKNVATTADESALTDRQTNCNCAYRDALAELVRLKRMKESAGYINDHAMTLEYQNAKQAAWAAARAALERKE